MNKKNTLSQNHRRVLSIVLRRIEKDLNEIIELMHHPSGGTTYEILKDLDSETIKKKNKTINEVKNLLNKIFMEYELDREVRNQNRIIEAKKSLLWSILEDTYSKKLNRFGKFNEELAEDFDKDISTLNNLIDNI